MRRLVNSFFAIIVPFILMYGINSVTGFHSRWLIFLVCFFFGYPILYHSRSFYYADKITRKEYIIDLHNNKLGDLFVPSSYPKYKKTNTGSDGNDYISDSGSIICTKFVDVKENVKIKENGISIHISCILICLFSFLLWSYMADFPSIGNTFESRVNIIVKHFSELKLDSFNRLANRSEEALICIGGNAEQMYTSMKSNIQFAFDGWNELLFSFSENIDKLLLDINAMF